MSEETEKSNSFFSGDTVKVIKGRLIIVIFSIVTVAVGANIKMTYDFKYVPAKISSNSKSISEAKDEFDKRFDSIIEKTALILKHGEQLDSIWSRLNTMERTMAQTESKHEGESGKFHEGLDNLKFWILDTKKDIRELRRLRGK